MIAIINQSHFIVFKPSKQYFQQASVTAERGFVYFIRVC